MKIIFARNIGFCSGVKRAIDIAEKSLEEDPKPVQFLGNLVHNELVMKRFIEKGGKIVSNLKQIKSGTLITKAHGISPTLKKRVPKSILVRNTVCPLVQNAQLKAEALLKGGYQVIIVGDRNHPEIKGIKGYTENKAIIIESENQAETLHFLKKVKGEKIGIISQTTQDLDKFNKILRILKNKAGEIKWFNTICPEVIVRQKELDKILENCNGILVIGSRSSANTKRLAEKAKKINKRVFWVNSLDELKRKKIKGISTLGVVSGTSAPDEEIEKIRTYLVSLGRTLIR